MDSESLLVEEVLAGEDRDVYAVGGELLCWDYEAVTRDSGGKGCAEDVELYVGFYMGECLG